MESQPQNPEFRIVSENFHSSVLYKALVCYPSPAIVVCLKSLQIVLDPD